MAPQDRRRRVNGPPGPPVRAIVLGFALLVIIAMLAGCVQARINAYYHPPKPPPCDIPVCDGACSDGRPILRCISRGEWSQL